MFSSFLLLFLLPSLLIKLAISAPPLSLHQIVKVEVGSYSVITLKGYDTDIRHELKATITSLPSSGKLYQLSSIYSNYGYEPIAGSEITSAGEVIIDPKMRVLYSRPGGGDREPVGKYDAFSYSVDDGASASSPGTVTVTGPKVEIVKSDFYLDEEGWSVGGNGMFSDGHLKHEKSSRGSLNHYIYGSDESLNISPSIGGSQGGEGNDDDLWYFSAPSKFLGWQGAVYGGTMEFTMSSFSGDFTKSNLNEGTYLVQLVCDKCKTNTGVTLGYPASIQTFDGSSKKFVIPMREDGGWLLDPENTLKSWTVPTKCDFLEVLGGLSSVKILGDFTRWYESVSIDDVTFKKDKAKSDIPICGQGTPDSSTCTCNGGFS